MYSFPLPHPLLSTPTRISRILPVIDTYGIIITIAYPVPIFLEKILLILNVLVEEQECYQKKRRKHFKNLLMLDEKKK